MLKLEQVCKVFGDQPKRALELLDAGKSKDRS
jgi:ABC-type proline/glycine betaine transport system ATPase subunit